VGVDGPAGLAEQRDGGGFQTALGNAEFELPHDDALLETGVAERGAILFKECWNVPRAVKEKCSRV